MSRIPQHWRDLAAFIDPVGRCPDPLTTGRPIDWYQIYALAAGQLVAPTLYAELVRTDRITAAPKDVQIALAELHRLNDERNDRLRSVLRDTVRILNDYGMEPLLFKGALTLLPGQSPVVRARMMSDIDFALHNSTSDRAAEALRAAGYWYADGSGPQTYPRIHHHAPLFHPDGGGYVEIHSQVLTSRAPVGALSLAEVRTDAEPLVWDELRLWAPSTEHRLLHNVLHHQVQDAAKHRNDCSLRQLRDFVQLHSSSTAIDWNAQADRLDSLEVGDALRGYLLLANHLFALPLPDGLTVSRAVLRSENTMWFRQRNPRLVQAEQFSMRFSRRAKRAPAKLRRMTGL